MRIVPLLGSWMPAIIFNNVDLPQPDGPSGQQCLHLTDRQPTVERTGGVSMPEHVRMYTPVQPGLLPQRAHHRPHGARSAF